MKFCLLCLCTAMCQFVLYGYKSHLCDNVVIMVFALSDQKLYWPLKETRAPSYLQKIQQDCDPRPTDKLTKDGRKIVYISSGSSLFWQLPVCKYPEWKEKLKPSRWLLTLKAPISTAADETFWAMFPIFDKNKVCYYMRIVCQQTIIMKYHALFVIFKKTGQKFNCRLLQIIGGALRVMWLVWIMSVVIMWNFLVGSTVWLV